MAQRIVRMSIRTVAPMMEFRVKEIMTKVEKDVRLTPGLECIETLVDRHDPNRYLVGAYKHNADSHRAPKRRLTMRAM